MSTYLDIDLARYEGPIFWGELPNLCISKELELTGVFLIRIGVMAATL